MLRGETRESREGGKVRGREGGREGTREGEREGTREGEREDKRVRGGDKGLEGEKKKCRRCPTAPLMICDVVWCLCYVVKCCVI